MFFKVRVMQKFIVVISLTRKLSSCDLSFEEKQ
ncbi:hypothetical protein SMU70_07896 [Streptococcus mutans NLML5]|nr:hypothetical protein SMU70_07896 [Streptococcus mutans NLML5]